MTPTWVVWLRRALVAAALLYVLVLLVTGIWLWSHYRPTAHVVWIDSVNPHVRGVERTRLVHRWAGQLLTLDALGLVALVIADPAARRRWWPAGAWFALGAIVLGFTGYLLPWDQLGLWAVTVGTNMQGMSDAFSDQVKFVLMGGAEIGKDTYHRWAIVHAYVLPIVTVVGVGAGSWFAVRRRSLTKQG